MLDDPRCITSVGGAVTCVRRALSDRMADTYTDAEDALWRVLYFAGYRYDEAADVVYERVHRSAVQRVRLASRIQLAAASRNIRLARKVAA